MANDNDIQIWATCTVQLNKYGVRPLKGSKPPMTASASRAQKVMRECNEKDSSQSEENPQSGNTDGGAADAVADNNSASNSGSQDGDKSTLAFYATGLTFEGAIQLLNNFDRSTKTSDYLDKAAAYTKAKAKYAETHEIKTLSGPGKVAYNAHLSKYAFRYYKVQIRVTYATKDGLKIKTVDSKVHCTLTKPSESEFLNRIVSACGSNSKVELVASLPKAQKEAES